LLPEYVRGVIRASNESGFAALDPKWSGGRPKTIGKPVRREVCLLARCCPRDLGPAFSSWSLAKLADGFDGGDCGHSGLQARVRGAASWLSSETNRVRPGLDFTAMIPLPERPRRRRTPVNVGLWLASLLFVSV